MVNELEEYLRLLEYFKSNQNPPILHELKLSAQVLGIFSPLMTDQMSREECYYLTKFAESTNLTLKKENSYR